MMPEAAADFILDVQSKRRLPAELIAIAGIPGAGKSTVANVLQKRVKDTVVVPMDGYHFPRSVLTPEQLVRRGAPDTFDSESLRADLRTFVHNGHGVFPAFDHAVKDPTPNAIEVPESAKLVIVEGLYLLLQSWQLGEIFDLTIFLDCDVNTAMERVAARHLACGLAATPDEARHRAETNDRSNAELILADGCREREPNCPPYVRGVRCSPA